MRPNVFAFGVAVSRNVRDGEPAQPDNANTYPYRLPLANPLLINIA